MEKVNFTNFVFYLLMLFAFQAQAQYNGVAYRGNTPQVGERVGVPVQIELEHYDALASDPNGDGANFDDDTDDIPAGGMGTYFDKSIGGSDAGNPIRMNSDVDIEAGATGAVLAGVQGAEYVIYTINVVTAGTYHMGVNYKHGGTSKDIKLFSHNVDGTGKTLLYDSLPDDGLPQADYTTTDNLGSFSLPAGPLLIRFRSLDAGPRFDFFTLTLDTAAEVEEEPEEEPEPEPEPTGYSGVAYQGNTPQVGETVGTPVQIELENYDALASDPNGDGANFNDDTDDIPAGQMGTYFDKSPGGSDAGNPVRMNSDVDLEAGATGAVLAGVQGAEYLVYTINVVTAGTYHMGVNYKHGGTSKDIKLFSHNVDGTGKTLLYNSLPDDGLPPADYTTTDNLGSFSLPAGPLLIRFRTLDAGPRFDFFTLTLDTADEVEPDPEPEPTGYSGVAYQGNIPQVGEAVGTPVQIELENYDALGSDPNGDGANFNDDTDDIPAGQMGTYFDKSPGGSDAGNPVRMNSDVDIEAGATGAVLAGVQGAEYLIYTINVATAGTYHLGVNYKHGGTSKDIKLFSHNVDGTGKTLLYDSLPDDGLPPADYTTTDNLGSFSLPAGPLLIRFRTLDAGPRFDFFTLTLDTADIVSSIDDEALNTNILEVFPNPASNGVFNINVEDEWEVYSSIGARVLEGIGNTVDLSNAPKGVYILRTLYGSIKLISK